MAPTRKFHDHEIMAANTEREDAIRWIQAQMGHYGLTLEEPKAAGCFDPPPTPPPPPAPSVCYRNAEGGMGRARCRRG